MKSIQTTQTDSKLTKNHPLTRYTAIGILLALLVIAGGCKNNDNNAAFMALSSSFDSLKYVTQTSTAEYNTEKIRYDDLATKKAQLDSQAAKKQAEIDKLRKELKGMRSKLAKEKSKKNKKNEQGMAASGQENLLNDYKFQIKSLESERDRLKSNVDDLTQQLDKMKRLASVAHVSNFRLQPLHERRNGKEKPTKKARKLNVMKVVFDVNENLIPEDGQKTLYLVLKSPDGKVEANGKDKPGSFVTSDGNRMEYTMEQSIMVKHGAAIKNVEADWKQEGNHEKGPYSLAVYNDGHLVGFGSVDLK
jgi:Skp family chaperone for outer membrane proteins